MAIALTRDRTGCSVLSLIHGIHSLWAPPSIRLPLPLSNTPKLLPDAESLFPSLIGSLQAAINCDASSSVDPPPVVFCIRLPLRCQMCPDVSTVPSNNLARGIEGQRYGSRSPASISRRSQSPTMEPRHPRAGMLHYSVQCS